MDHHRHHHPLGGPPGPPTGLPPRAPPPGHPDDRDRSIPGPPKRSRIDTRTPPNGDIYSHTHLQQQQHPIHAGIQRQYKEVSRSPEMERMTGPGPYRPAPPPPPHPSQQQQPQRHESVPQTNAIHPASSRNSPFMPPHRTSTPEGHQRVPSVHNSPRLFRAPPPPPPPPQDAMMQQSLQQQHAQHSQHHRGMPPPSSPHHNPLAPPPQQPQQRPPPSHHHSSGPPPSFGQGPPGGPGRDLPSLSSLSTSRPSMSISSMLGSSDPPAPPSHVPHPSPISTHSLPPSSSRPSEFSPLKRPYTPDLNGVSGADRDRQISSNSASPSTGNAPLPGFPGSKPNRTVPQDHVYRAHQQLQYHSLGHSREHPREREHQQVEIMGPQGPPQRQMSQPVTSNISSVLQEEPLQRPGLGNDNERRQRYEREWYEKERENQLERERQRDEERNREREREHREREHREREHREREHREREHREREHREREHREREAKERNERERARARERTERVNAVQATLGQQVFGREPHRLEHQHQPPQTSSSHLSYPIPITSRMSAGQDTMIGPPPVSAISTSSAMAMPQTSTSGTGGLGPTPAPLPTATTTGREGFQSFTGYTTPMPPSPFAIPASLPVLPPVVEGGRDSRRQGFLPQREAGSQSFGRDEPTRAEDALQRGLSRQSSGLGEEDRRRRTEKDRDGLMRDRDGLQRLNGPNVGNQSPPKRMGMGMGGMEMVSMTRNWSEDFQKTLMDNNREREREEAGKLSLGLGKRERDRDEEEAAKMEKKKKHHHHQHHAGVHHHRFHHPKQEDTVGAPNLEVPVSRAGARSKSPNSHVHIHHSYLHHPHTPLVHHHHASAASALITPPTRVRTSLLIDSSKVMASLSKPRNFLGSIIYHPTPTPKQGYSVTQPLLPRFEGKENSIFQVRIPRRFLSEQQRRDVHRRRCVWGTDVYTDDSDVLGVLVHLGRVPGVLPEGVDPALVADNGNRKIVITGQTSASPRSPPISSPIKKKAVNGTSNGKAEKQQVQDGPTIPAGKDLIVDLLILPTLEKYTGSTRNALKSRSWNTIHDGMSYSIWDMEWVEAGEAEARGGGSKKRRLDEREWVRRWGELPPSRGGMGKNGWGKNRWSVGDGRARSKGKVAEVGA